MPGTTFGKYAVVRPLGHGGMGVVYLAKDVKLNREVALKTLRQGLAVDKALAAFEREAQAVAALSHPNIIHINSLDVIENQVVIDMPYLGGGSMCTLIERGLRLPRLASILSDVLQALACCHAAGIAHCDVKPSNVLFDSSLNLKLSDFGVARLMHGAWEQTIRTGTTAVVVAGTPHYMPPEAWEGAKPSETFDLYAVGMIAREAVAGLPEELLCATPMEFMRALATLELPPVADVSPGVSSEFSMWIHSLTSRKPESRPESAARALEWLKKCPEYSPSEGSGSDTVQLPAPKLRLNRPTRSLTDSKSRARKRRWRLLGASAVGCALVAAAVFVYGPPRSAQLSADAAPRLQHGLMAESLPNADELLRTWKTPDFETIHVMRFRSTEPGGAEGMVKIKRSENGSRTALLYSANALWHLIMEPDDKPGDYRIAGNWAGYEMTDGQGFRWGSLAGAAAAGDSEADPIWIHLEYHDQGVPNRRSETFVAMSQVQRMTDTQFLVGLERTSAGMPLVFNEMRARRLPAYDLWAHELPALAASFLVIPGDPSLRINVDGRLDEADWRLHEARAFLPGRPLNSNLELLFAADSTALKMACLIPNAKPATELHVAILPAFSIGDGGDSYYVVRYTEDTSQMESVTTTARVPLRQSPSAAFRWEGSDLHVECEIRFEDIGLSPTPERPIFLRLNAALIADGAFAQWGWPDFDDPRHGALLRVDVSGGLGGSAE